MSLYDYFSEQELDVLQMRAERAARTDRVTLEEGATVDALVVTVGSETYALPLEALTAAYQVNVNLSIPIVPVPCTPPFVKGIANIRGRVVPVIDLAALLSIPSDVATNSTALVIVAKEDMTIAFSADVIGDTTAIPRSALSPVPETVDLAKADYLQGTLSNGTVLLDVDAILRDPALMNTDKPKD